MKHSTIHKRWLFFLIPVLIICLFFLWPLPHELTKEITSEPVKIFDRNGVLLYEYRQDSFGSQDYLPIDSIPESVLRIVLSVEDRDFYSHIGISPKAILRAAWQNFHAGKIVSGGSTITQQLIKNRLKPKRRSYLYKLKEAILAIKLETRYQKNEILESYLNSVYFGHQAYGIGAASKVFLEKNLSELSLAEASFLIGLIQSPTAYDPYRHFEQAKDRQKIVLQAMADEKLISESEIEEILNEPVKLGSGKIEIKAPHFVMWVLKDLNPDSNEIKTTLDYELQSEIELIIKNHLSRLEDKNVTSAAVVVLDTATGDVLSMVGSADYFDDEHDGQVNVALSPRQPGSALKPFTYSLALKKGDTAATTVADIETQFFTQEGNPYIPRNYDYGYHGLVRYREALANSYNISAVKVLEKVGVETLMTFLQKAGISTFTGSPEHYGLALTLGDAEVKLLELSEAYGMLAREGKTLFHRSLLDEETADGKRILDEKIAWLITDILDDDEARLPEFGSGGPLEFSFPVAAKTGTTRNSRDNWTIGYTPEVVVGVWVGNADNSAMIGTSGITGAGPIFHDTMLTAMKDRPKRSFIKPEGIISKEVCRLSGKLPTDYCPHTLKEWFILGTEPQVSDDIYKLISIDKRNNLLAGQNCSSEFTEEKVFAIFPPELKTWARENGWPAPPAEYSPLCLPEDDEGGTWISIEKPNPSDYFLLDPLVPDENENIIFQASASDDIEEVEWYVNDEKVGEGLPPLYRFEWQPEVGDYTVKAVSGNIEKEVMIKVINNSD